MNILKLYLHDVVDGHSTRYITPHISFSWENIVIFSLPYAGPVIDSAIDQQVIVSSYDRMMFSDGIKTVIVVKSWQVSSF